MTSPIVDRRWRDVRRLLVVCLDNLGDVLMATPAIAALRSGLRDARITLLASRSGAAIATYLDDIDDAIVFDAPWVKGVGDDDDADAAHGRAERELIETLAARRFDAAVVFTTCTQSALPALLVCRVAGIALALAHVRENPYRLASDRVIDSDIVADGMRHEVARQLALVGHAGFATRDDRLRFGVRDADRRSVAARLAAFGVHARRRYAVFQPGANAESRRWAPAKFGIAAERIARERGVAVVWSGSAGEQVLVEEARQAGGGIGRSLAGALTLGELAALIDGAVLVVANNSAAAHLAAAVSTPVVDLYALTNPQHTPWRVASRVLHAPRSGRRSGSMRGRAAAAAMRPPSPRPSPASGRGRWRRCRLRRGAGR